MTRGELYFKLYGALEFGCGPSAQQQQLQGQEQSFTETLMGSYETNLKEQQAALAHINGVLAPIVDKGPDQTGFSPAERAALNTQAIDTTGAAAARAERAIGTETAGRGDSGNLPQSGVDQALKASAASAASGELASEQLGITEADYATGRQNFESAVAGEEGVAGQYNPVPTAGQATGADTAAFNEATQINQEQNQVEADIAGGVTSLAGGAIKGFTGGFGGGGAPYGGSNGQIGTANTLDQLTSDPNNPGYYQ